MKPLYTAANGPGSKWLMGLVATSQVLLAQTVFVGGGSGLREYNAGGSLIGQTVAPSDFITGAIPPQGVAYSLDGVVYGISRSAFEPIQKYTPGLGSSELVPNPQLGILTFQSTGSIAVDGAGNLVVPGNGNAANGSGAVVMRFRSDGTLIGGTKIQGASPFPSGGVFSSGIGIGLEGSIFVSDGPKIFRVSSDLGTSSLFLSDSDVNVVYSGLAFDPSGILYAARHTLGSPASGEIHKYSPAGADLGTYLSGLDNPGGIAFDAAGALYVADTASILKKAVAGSVSTFANVSGPNWIATDFYLQTAPPPVPEASTWGAVLFVVGAVVARALRSARAIGRRA